MMDREDYFDDIFERQGPHLVRQKMATGGYNVEILQYAATWLAKHDRHVAEQQRAVMVDQTEIARSAKDAAWASATAAAEANEIAIKAKDQARWAFWLSVAALIVSTIVGILAVYAQLAN